MPSTTGLTTDTLLALQPDYYANSKVMHNIDNANATELNNLNNKITVVYNNLYLDSCDDNTLTRWEKILNLDCDNNVNANFRRSRIYSRLRGQGTFTVAFLQNVAESFENGEVDVIEDNANYAFTVKFVGVKGIPSNLDDLKAVIEELKPAHLAVNYIFAYMLWSEFDNYNKTFSQWDNLNLAWTQFEDYKE